ncbi:MAG TPA: chemotaxis protein CheX [Spirochaetota bacterium]
MGQVPVIHERALLFYQNISESAAFVFTSLVNSEPKQKKVFQRRLASLPNDIIIRFDFEADIAGYFAYFFSKKNALAICDKLVPGIDNTFFDADHLDILGELGNMISGNTLSKLVSVSSEIRLEPPRLAAFHEILSDERHHHSYSSNFEIELGKMGVLLAIKKV